MTFDGAKAEGVTFSYDGEIPVLKDVYADIKKGSVVRNNRQERQRQIYSP